MTVTLGAVSPSGATPNALPIGSTGHGRRELDQAAEVELDEVEADDDVDDSEEEADEEEDDDEAEEDFDEAGELLDDEPRLSFR
ncbi:hypothetical protein GCM10017752_40890 [Streptomyces roseoviridis]